ncbi:putative MYB DNA-binding domain-containing protein [Rosellinia necatrix]|uniref:Putative MYB DNA-binding domain-containing protein n=1 Tax=Rosellinia necatrix TaxID=77044 RepID=A0A1W2TP78_ROSNE|nr:putative MYB DNA-binding domain-containing protein [Rosellinia necatrix]
MATIEPRLIHLLNESTTTPRPYSAELPPLKAIYPQTSSRPHPIEPGQRSDALDVNGGLLAPQSIPSLYSVTDETLTAPPSRKDVASYATADRPFSTHVTSQGLRMVLDDAPVDNIDDVSTRKRPVKEDFPQLPQPPKKQKPTTHMFPPMIVGLLEPPSNSNAALFPPISSSSFESRPRSEPPQALNLTKPPDVQGLPEETIVPSPPPDAERTPTGKIKRRAAKPRRKWSEEETNHLLLGVSKHGVGRWTDILEDPGYKFNERTAGDLKDRFRTCCPEELRGSTGAKGDGLELPAAPRNEKKPRKGLMSENILNDTEEEIETDRTWPGQNDSESVPKQRKSRAHRKKLEDLAELGIKGPFKKSQRRERRPFSEQDDREILEGFELYGPHWTKIQRDPRFNLSSRQPTDLRDRLRNKYPEKFVSTEKTTMQVRETGGRGNNLLEPSVNTAIENSLSLSKTSLLEPQLNRTGSREDIPKWPLLSGAIDIAEHIQPHSALFWGEGGGGGFPSGEMDISRLLLDDTQIMGEPLTTDRRGFG